MPDSTRNWDSIGIGIITFATILAAATAAGIFAVAGQQDSYPEWARAVAAPMVTLSLLAYLAVLLFGMTTLFRERKDDRKAQIVLTARAAFLQAYSAVLSVFLVIYSRLF